MLLTLFLTDKLMQNTYKCMKKMLIFLLFSAMTHLNAKTVFVTIPPQAGIVKQLTNGLGVEIKSLTKGNMCPETFSPTPKQIEALSKADLFMSLGMPFEDLWIKKVGILNKTKIVSMSEGIKLRDVEKSDHDHHHKHHHGTKDPHVWTSINNIIIMASNSAKALKELIPEASKTIDKNLSAFLKKAKNLDKEIKKELATSKENTLFVFHPYYGYFTDSYGLIQIPIEAEGKTPTAKQLDHLIKKIKEQNKRIILTQPEFDNKIARSLAEQTGAKLINVSIYSEDVLDNVEALAKVWK
jgi:zinc transport system substrate-binding protein